MVEVKNIECFNKSLSKGNIHFFVLVGDCYLRSKEIHYNSNSGLYTILDVRSGIKNAFNANEIKEVIENNNNKFYKI